MIPRSRKDSRQNSLTKKYAHFQSQMAKQASEKEKMQQEMSSSKRRGGYRKSLNLQSLQLLKPELKAKQSQFT